MTTMKKAQVGGLIKKGLKTAGESVPKKLKGSGSLATDAYKGTKKDIKAKNGKSFPDLNKDGKITKADILKGRGVIAKKGATIEKAQLGKLIKKGVKRVGNEVRAIKKGVEEGRKAYTDSKWRAQLRDPSRPFPKMVDGPGFDGRPFPKRKQPNHKTGGTVSNTKKCKYGCK